jgi:low affinity Fe/Cu permease
MERTQFMDTNPPPSALADLFRRLACQSAEVVGSSAAFIAALAVVIVWAVTGPLFGFSDTWQLVINTGTTIVTFLMVFLIQNAQNREGKTLQLKLDELIHAIKEARDEIIDVEELSDEELARLHQEYANMSKHHEAELERRAANGSQRPSGGTPAM